jgi:hypothetical protein
MTVKIGADLSSFEKAAQRASKGSGKAARPATVAYSPG